MKMKKFLILAAAAGAVLALGGCTRSQINYQIAECIGTLGEYENNEPVETPKMKAERELQESEAQVAADRQAALDEAEALALSYEYEAAISYIQNTELLAEDEEALALAEKCQKDLDNMYEYTGSIGNLCFTNLVVDTDMAFDGDDYASIYQDTMITLTEFTKILDALYEGGYVLIDIHSLAQVTQNGNSVSMTAQNPILPNGKKPLILSIDNLNYGSVRNGDGVPTQLTLDSEGNVMAVYTDAGGHDLTGAYDVIPVVEAFIDEHPDFSFRGARGIVGLSGSKGAFGYLIEEGQTASAGQNQEMVRQIAAKLAADGWTFACEGYSYQYMGNLNYDSLKEDITAWQSSVGSLIGSCDTLMFPYGSEVDYTTEKGAYVTNLFPYLLGLWAEDDYLSVNSTYLRQTRRTVTGLILENYPNNLSTYFSTAAVIDAARG